jgi:hypothetical protein
MRRALEYARNFGVAHACPDFPAQELARMEVDLLVHHEIAEVAERRRSGLEAPRTSPALCIGDGESEAPRNRG